jgi:hypothetical protein
MCMVQGEVEHISKTNIIVGKLNNDTQFTVYSNKIDLNKNFNFMNGREFILPKKSQDNVAMILPFPKGELRIYNMTGKGEVFDTLKHYFPTMLFGHKNSGSRQMDSRQIDVVTVGSYETSIVPEYKDFKYLQNDYFNLEKGMQKILERDYSKDYGFLVCKIKEGATFHPIAYSHPLRSDSNFFIPTKHYHNNSENDPDWDHEIYVLGGNTINIDKNGFGIKHANYKNDKLDVPFNIKSTNDLNQIKISKYYRENHDILVHAN